MSFQARIQRMMILAVMFNRIHTMDKFYNNNNDKKFESVTWTIFINIDISEAFDNIKEQRDDID